MGLTTVLFLLIAALVVAVAWMLRMLAHSTQHNTKLQEQASTPSQSALLRFMEMELGSTILLKTWTEHAQGIKKSMFMIIFRGVEEKISDLPEGTLIALANASSNGLWVFDPKSAEHRRGMLHMLNECYGKKLEALLRRLFTEDSNILRAFQDADGKGPEHVLNLLMIKHIIGPDDMVMLRFCAETIGIEAVASCVYLAFNSGSKSSGTGITIMEGHAMSAIIQHVKNMIENSADAVRSRTNHSTCSLGAITPDQLRAAGVRA